MIEEPLMPLDRHFDSGFGMTANSFHDAARNAEEKGEFGLTGSPLPVFYLYRHANELYLKSIITILFRRFVPSYPQIDSSEFPLILVGSTEKKIFQVHSILCLYNAFKKMLDENSAEIRNICATDWVNIPPEINEHVDKIESADAASTSFRYPITLNPAVDSAKSSFKEVDFESALQNKTGDNGRGALILGVKNQDNEIVASYAHDNDPLPGVLSALSSLAETLSGAHAGLHYELLSKKKEMPNKAV